MLFIGLHVLVVFKNVIKTDRNLIIKLDEHGTKVDQPMYQHLSNCSAFNDHIMLFTLPGAAPDTTIVSKESHLQNAVINNIKILDKNDKWGQLQFLETVVDIYCFFVLIYRFYHVFIYYNICFYRIILG